MTGQIGTEYSTRHPPTTCARSAGNTWSTNPNGPPLPRPTRSRSHHRRPLTLRDQVIAPIIAGVRSPRLGRKPVTWTPVDRDYETLGVDLQTLFTHIGITTTQPAAA
jgi:hypothetical protein